MSITETERLKEYLNSKKVNFKFLSHEPVFTSLQAAKVRNAELKSGVKALLFKIPSGEFLIGLIRADKRISEQKLSKLVGSELKLAHTKELIKETGCKPGSLHPFGNLWNIKVIMDKNFDVEDVNFNAGSNTCSVHMKLQDLIRLIKPVMAEISE